MEKSRKSFGIMASECRLSSTVRSVDNNNYSVSILIIRTLTGGPRLH